MPEEQIGKEQSPAKKVSIKDFDPKDAQDVLTGWTFKGGGGFGYDFRTKLGDGTELFLQIHQTSGVVHMRNFDPDSKRIRSGDIEHEITEVEYTTNSEGKREMTFLGKNFKYTIGNGGLSHTASLDLSKQSSPSENTIT